MHRHQTFTFADFLANAAHLGLRETGRFMSYEKRVLMGRAVAAGIFTRLKGFRRRVDGNLQLIFPERSPEWRRSLSEHMHIDAFAERIGNLNITGAGAPLLDTGRGAVFITGHFGQWEGIRLAWRHATGGDCGFLFRPNNNGFYDRNWQHYLRQAGQPLFATNSEGKAAMLAHLAAGKAVLFANDQHRSKADYLQFLGHPARTATTAAKLALDYDLPLIPAFATRRKNLFDYDVEFSAPIAPSDPVRMTQAATDVLSSRVLERPEQYFWAHRRWR